MDSKKKQATKLLYTILIVVVFLGLFISCQTAGRGPRETAPQKVQPAKAPRNIDKAVKENPRENLPYCSPPAKLSVI